MTERQLVNANETILKELVNSFGTRILKATVNEIVAINEGKRADIIFEWLSNDRCYIKVYAPNSVTIINDYKDLIKKFWLAFYG